MDDAELRQAITPAHASAGLRWLATLGLSTQWRLSLEEIAILLGDVPASTLQIWFEKAMRHEEVELSPEILGRIGMLLGIYRALKIIAPADRPELGVEWFSTPNSAAPFHGKSIREYLLAKPTTATFVSVLAQLKPST